MKIFPAILAHFLASRSRRQNLVVLVRLLGILGTLIVIYSVTFHLLMAREGHDFSWLTGFYWTLTVMSTLGFGDITFHGDAGRLFSMLVLGTGMLFLLVLLPFTFVEFFYAPWMEAQKAASTPRELPEETKGHVLLTHHGLVTVNLIKKLRARGITYALVIPTMEEAHRLGDLGYSVVLGDLDDSDTYRRIRLDQAAMFVAIGTDTANTNAAFTARGIAPHVKIVATASREPSLEVLRLAGANQVIQLATMLGQSLARRCNCGAETANLLGRFDELAIAEAPVAGTDLVGRTLLESRLRELTGVSVVGVWERGHFATAYASTPLTANTVMVLTGSDDQIAAFNNRFSRELPHKGPVLIIGGGRVGRAASAALDARGIDNRIIERLPDRIKNPDKFVLGDAFEHEVLKEAGIATAPAAILTTHDDDTNVYMAIFIRRLRPDIQLVARSNHERNISTLHRAGADFVMSYASMGSNAILNLLQSGSMLMVAEGLDLVRVRVPFDIAGKSIAESGIRDQTGCSVVGIRTEGHMSVNPPPDTIMNAEDEIVLIGTSESEQNFLEKYPATANGNHA